MKKFGGPIFSAALLALLLWAYTRHNNFPFYYHTDEPGKVEQVISGEHNYRHPLLMINATDLVVRALRKVSGNVSEMKVPDPTLD